MPIAFVGVDATNFFCRRFRLTLMAMSAALLASLSNATVQAQGSAALQSQIDQVKPRLIVLTDIGNEPDDQMSFVRLLLYSNEIDIEALVAATSTWQRQHTNPQTMREIIAAYADVRPNLEKHATGWPDPSLLEQAVTTGQSAYGMEAVGLDKMSPGAEAIIRAVARPDPRPLWISIWGGANTLAEALLYVRSTRTPEAVDAFVAKLKVYSISDQDDAGPWIRREFPKLFYIVKPSPPNGEEYASATWTGISGDVFYRNGEGADGSSVTNAWLQSHIRTKGPLGKHYPQFAYIMEGDTPSFLSLIGNGLNSDRDPSWGGWGGRYVFRQPYGETHAIWTQGGDAGGRITSQDVVTGVDGRIHISDQATIWRWRTAFQNDFAARMDWTIKPFRKANHNPIAIVNGVGGTAPILVDAQVGQPVVLDADMSHDPDGQKLTYRWISYPEAGFEPGQRMAEISIRGERKGRATITPVATCRARWIGPRPSCPDGIAHIILEVTDNGSPALTSYRRVILTIHARKSD